MRNIILISILFSAATSTVYSDGSIKLLATDVALYDYMSFKKLNRNKWIKKDNDIVAKKPINSRDFEDKKISLIRALEVTASGTNNSNKSLRQAFVIQDSIVQPGADYPEQDSYTCSIIVYIFHKHKWQQESINIFTESGYEGSTRWAKSCDDFELSWEKELPVLMREQTYGPYMGGIYVSTVEKVHRKESQYKLEVIERTEGELE